MRNNDVPLLSASRNKAAAAKFCELFWTGGSQMDPKWSESDVNPVNDLAMNHTAIIFVLYRKHRSIFLVVFHVYLHFEVFISAVRGGYRREHPLQNLPLLL